MLRTAPTEDHAALHAAINGLRIEQSEKRANALRNKRIVGAWRGSGDACEGRLRRRHVPGD
jgi:hypothetical protein